MDFSLDIGPVRCQPASDGAERWWQGRQAVGRCAGSQPARDPGTTRRPAPSSRQAGLGQLGTPRDASGIRVGGPRARPRPGAHWAPSLDTLFTGVTSNWSEPGALLTGGAGRRAAAASPRRLSLLLRGPKERRPRFLRHGVGRRRDGRSARRFVFALRRAQLFRAQNLVTARPRTGATRQGRQRLEWDTPEVASWHFSVVRARPPAYSLNSPGWRTFFPNDPAARWLAARLGFQFRSTPDMGYRLRM
jgi:hypothetical protein